MTTKHTPGPWTVTEGADTDMLTVIIDPRHSVVAKAFGTSRLTAESNALLIAAAPIGLAAAEEAYAAILQIPMNHWRISNQSTYCALRDFIAEATGRTSEDVQNEYEAAAIAKATGK